MSEQDQDLDLKEKIQQQFDEFIYPRVPINKSPKIDYNEMFIHNLVTPYYLRNQQVIDTVDKVILDAGCGSGFTTLTLAEANPHSKIVGIDFSEKSIEQAKLRLQYHGFNNVEFEVLSVEDIPTLCQEFDYINCDEVLCLLPNIVTGLKAMKKVLKPSGIIRTNLHSSIGRRNQYYAQEIFKMMGLMNGKLEKFEIEIVRETMNSLKDDVRLKQMTWLPNFADNDEYIAMNFLLQGDKGSTIPDVFNYLREAGLEFISMVYWREWEILDLFKERDNLPAFLDMSLPETSLEERLHLYELLNPIHRLLDFWCGHPDQSKKYLPVTEWTNIEWQKAKISLHPQLKNDQVRNDLIECIQKNKPFLISNYIKVCTKFPIYIESIIGACLLPLWDGPCTLQSLVERYLQVIPLDPITLKLNTQEQAQAKVKETILSLDPFMYVLVELD